MSRDELAQKLFGKNYADLSDAQQFRVDDEIGQGGGNGNGTTRASGNGQAQATASGGGNANANASASASGAGGAQQPVGGTAGTAGNGGGGSSSSGGAGGGLTLDQVMGLGARQSSTGKSLEAPVGPNGSMVIFSPNIYGTFDPGTFQDDGKGGVTFAPYNGPLTGSLPGTRATAGGTASGASTSATRNAEFNAGPGYDPKTFAQWGGSVIYPKDGSSFYGEKDGVNYSRGNDGNLHPADAKVDPLGAAMAKGGDPPFPKATGEAPSSDKQANPSYTDNDFTKGGGSAPYSARGSQDKNLRNYQGSLYEKDPSDQRWYLSKGTDTLGAKIGPPPQQQGGGQTPSQIGANSLPGLGVQTQNQPSVTSGNSGGVSADKVAANQQLAQNITANNFATPNIYAQEAAAGTGAEVPAGQTFKAGSPAAVSDDYDLNNPFEQARLAGTLVKPSVMLGTSGGNETLINPQNPAGLPAGVQEKEEKGLFLGYTGGKDVAGEAGGGTVGDNPFLNGKGGQAHHVEISEPSVVIPEREVQPGQHVSLRLGEVRPEMATEHQPGEWSVENHVPGTHRYTPGEASGGSFGYSPPGASRYNPSTGGNPFSGPGFESAVISALSRSLAPKGPSAPAGINMYKTLDNGKQDTYYVNPYTGLSSEKPYEVEDWRVGPGPARPATPFKYNPGQNAYDPQNTEPGFAGGGDFDVAPQQVQPQPQAMPPPGTAFGRRGLPGMVGPAAAIGASAFKALAAAKG